MFEPDNTCPVQTGDLADGNKELHEGSVSELIETYQQTKQEQASSTDGTQQVKNDLWRENRGGLAV